MTHYPQVAQLATMQTSCYASAAMSGVGAAYRRVVTTLRDSGPLWTASLMLDRVLPVGILGLWPERTVSAEVLAAQLEAFFHAWGMSAEHTSITVEQILYADLHGIDSHGATMLPQYHRDLVAGLLTMTPAIALVRESEATALLDGGGGLGHVPADTAMKLAIEKCRHTGLAAVAVRHSGHYGAAGAYAAMAARAGFIGLATTNTRRPAVVPTFGTEARLGTNPIAFAAPAARNRPFLLDMATSAASLGQLWMAWRKGRPIPPGWALDRKGRAVTSGRLGAEGRRLAPLGGTRELGGHKGYGLATAVEILSSVLSGGRSAPGAAGGDVGHFFLALDPARLRDEGDFGADLDVLLDWLRATAAVDPRQPVLVAGDPEYAAEARHRRAGIPFARGVIEDLRSVARTSGVAFVLDP